jgi:hypothetical protein
VAHTSPSSSGDGPTSLSLMTFADAVLKPVRGHLRRRIAVPVGAEWCFDAASSEISVDIPALALNSNFQLNLAATPSFWSASATGGSKRQPSQSSAACAFTSRSRRKKSRLHWRRALFIIDQLERVLGERFVAELPERWEWPSVPFLNIGAGDRSLLAPPGSNAEHILETSLCSNQLALAEFCEKADPISRFRRQLPVGVFDERVSKKTHWTVSPRRGPS